LNGFKIVGPFFKKQNTKIMRCKVFLSVLMLIAITSCERKLYKSYNENTAKRLYDEAIAKTVDITKERIATDLLSITLDSSNLKWKDFAGEMRLLTVMWKSTPDTKYYKNDCATGFYNSGDRYNFVTVVPELKNACRETRFGVKEGVNYRLEQLLGIESKSEKTYFVEVWVRPQDLIRPCRDTDVTDRSCGIVLGDTTVAAYRSFVKWLNENNKGYPFTQLGYTYDWNKQNRSHRGLSEFLIKRNSNIIVKDFIETSEYCFVRNIER
jgi:hypothetical protein